MLFSIATAERQSKLLFSDGAADASQEHTQRMHSFDHVHLSVLSLFFEKCWQCTLLRGPVAVKGCSLVVLHGKQVCDFSWSKRRWYVSSTYRDSNLHFSFVFEN